MFSLSYWYKNCDLYYIFCDFIPYFRVFYIAFRLTYFMDNKVKYLVDGIVFSFSVAIVFAIFGCGFIVSVISEFLNDFKDDLKQFQVSLKEFRICFEYDDAFSSIHLIPGM